VFVDVAPAHEPLKEGARHREVRLDGLAHVGVLHLDDHVAPVGKGGPVHLPDGGGGHGVRLKRVEDHLRKLSQRVADALAHQGLVHGRHAVLRLRHHLHELVRQHAGVHAHRLRQLEGRAPQARKLAEEVLGVLRVEVALALVGIPAAARHPVGQVLRVVLPHLQARLREDLAALQLGGGEVPVRVVVLVIHCSARVIPGGGIA